MTETQPPKDRGTECETVANESSQLRAEFARMERLLAPYSARARLPHRLPTLAYGSDHPRSMSARPRPGPLRRYLHLSLAASSVCAVILLAAFAYRLWWPEDAPWLVASGEQHWHWQPGTALSDAEPGSPTRPKRVAVARIGVLELAPTTRATLVDTGTGHHRLELVEGRLKAKIWAPPGWFGVRIGEAEVIDLGCEFDLQHTADGSGSVQVLSGWIAWRHGLTEHLVPAGFRLDYSSDQASIAFRPDASAQLRSLLDQFRTADAEHRQTVADHIARVAEPADSYTLLDLLTRYPELASSQLYPSLAEHLGALSQRPESFPRSSEHRQAWARGDMAAINRWWDVWPVPPKAWWRHWRDAFER